jgi:DNA recombination protein RmuC
LPAHNTKNLAILQDILYKPFDASAKTIYNPASFKGSSMLIVQIIVLVVIAAVLVAALVIISGRFAVHQKTLDNIAQQLDSLKTAHSSVSENLNKTLLDSQTSLNQNLQSSQRILNDLNTKIGSIQQTGTQMVQIQSDLRTLQSILSSPKLRGNLGEWSLNSILENMLPKDSFILQYSFKDNQKVDCVIKLSNFLVPIDAKFPLENFKRIINSQNDDEKIRSRRAFFADVTKHIDKIASSYIRPAEGTLDFAFMYIPAENVYYETAVENPDDKKSLLEYALDKKVIPVGPSLLYAYLMTVVMGLHGMQIEKQAHEILSNLKKLNSSFADFSTHWETLGKHLKNAYGQYDEGQTKLTRFGTHLEQIQNQQPQ